MLDHHGKAWLLETNNSPGLEYCASHFPDGAEDPTAAASDAVTWYFIRARPVPFSLVITSNSLSTQLCMRQKSLHARVFAYAKMHTSANYAQAVAFTQLLTCPAPVAHRSVIEDRFKLLGFDGCNKGNAGNYLRVV